jgi:hypothetical protein
VVPNGLATVDDFGFAANGSEIAAARQPSARPARRPSLSGLLGAVAGAQSPRRAGPRVRTP